MCGYVWAHGGGGISGHAVIDNGILCKLAIANDLVVVNVEYRLAPEHKSPAGAKDMIIALKYLIQNSQTYGVDPEKIAFGGVVIGTASLGVYYAD